MAIFVACWTQSPCIAWLIVDRGSVLDRGCDPIEEVVGEVFVIGTRSFDAGPLLGGEFKVEGAQVVFEL